jgi:hypothetical protein
MFNDWSRKIKEDEWARHVACLTEMENTGGFLVGTPKIRNHFGDMVRDERI